MKRFKPSALALALLGSASLLSPAMAFPAATPEQSDLQPKPAAPMQPSGQTDGDNAASKESSSRGPASQAPMTMAQIETRIEKDRAAFFEARLAALHAGLQLQADQDGLWSSVEGAIRDFAKLRRPHEDKAEAKDDSDDDGNDHAGIERLRARSEHLIKKGQAMKKLVEATEPLLDSLSAAQKERLPILLEGLPPHRILQRAFGLDDQALSNDAGAFGGGSGAEAGDDPRISGFGRGPGRGQGPRAGYGPRFQPYQGDRSDIGGAGAAPSQWAIGRSESSNSDDD